MKTFIEFLEWCRKNPNTPFHALPSDLYDVTFDWRLAIAENTDPMVQNLRTPADLRAVLKQAINVLGESLTDDIQRTFNEL